MGRSKYSLLLASLVLAAPIALADGAQMQGSTVRCYPEDDAVAVPEIHVGTAGALGLIVVGGLMLLNGRRRVAAGRLSDNG